MMLSRLFRLLLDGTAVEGGGSGSGGTTETKTETKVTTPDLTKGAESLVSKHGDPLVALKVVMAENYEFREKNRQLRTRIAPKDHAVVPQAEADKLKAYQSLGTPEELGTKLKDGSAALEAVATNAREKVRDQVATIHKFKPAVLDRLSKQDGITLAVKTVKDAAGKDITQTLAIYKDDKGKDVETVLGDYVDKHWKEFLPSLREDGSTQQQQQHRRPAAEGTPSHRHQGQPRPAIEKGDGQTKRRTNVF